MQRSARNIRRPIVHVVGCVTDEVFSFLRPATQALSASGREQIIVVIDDARRRDLLNKLERFAKLRVVTLSRNPVAHWQKVLQVCRELVTFNPPEAMHFHGFIACLVGASAVRRSAHKIELFYTPHSSRSHRNIKLFSSLLMLLLQSLMGESRRGAIVNSAAESSLFDDWTSSEFLESPVSEAFQTVQPREVGSPLIVSSGGQPNAQSVELFAQLAVLFGGKELSIRFKWIGSVDAISGAKFQAAGVSVYEPTCEADHASQLAGGWLYIAPRANRGFPIYLVQAMAAGLSCVAVDCPEHRSVIKDGHTGYLCATENEIIDRVAKLFDDPSLRRLHGTTAKFEAKLRFDESQFGEKLLASYSLPPKAPS